MNTAFTVALRQMYVGPDHRQRTKSKVPGSWSECPSVPALGTRAALTPSAGTEGHSDRGRDRDRFVSLRSRAVFLRISQLHNYAIVAGRLSSPGAVLSSVCSSGPTNTMPLCVTLTDVSSCLQPSPLRADRLSGGAPIKAT